MTNGWIDIKNTDMMLVMGGNPAENHPCGFKWAVEAKRDRNAKMIVVDPRFTRTAATWQICSARSAPEADIAFLGGVIRYAIENNRIAKDYLDEFHQCRFHREGGIQVPEDGSYSGFDAAADLHKTYQTRNASRAGITRRSGTRRRHGAAGLPREASLYDHTRFRHSPAAYYQLLRQQYSRYTPEIVERITGIPKEQFLKAADLFTSVRNNGDMKKVGDDHIRGGMDPAQLRHADHPHGCDAAIAAGQRRTGGRRRQRTARPLQHPGRDGYGRALSISCRVT